VGPLLEKILFVLKLSFHKTDHPLFYLREGILLTRKDRLYPRLQKLSFSSLQTRGRRKNHQDNPSDLPGCQTVTEPPSSPHRKRGHKMFLALKKTSDHLFLVGKQALDSKSQR